MARIDNLFDVAKGKGGYIRDFAPGSTPLISATSQDNGVATLISHAPDFKAPAITVERVAGSAFVQLLDFSTVPDDLNVLIPKKKMELNQLYALAGFINNSKWRFSYARKLTPTRLKSLEVPTFDNISVQKVKSLIPKIDKSTQSISLPNTTFKNIPIVTLFHIKSGDFHKAEELVAGQTPLISCGNSNNGIIRFCSVPEKYIYHNALTVAYNGQPLLTKYHPYRFAAKDDVAVLIPKQPTSLATLFFVRTMLNREMWRYSYGRKCFRGKLSVMSIPFPQKNGKIDESYIDLLFSRTGFSKYLPENIELDYHKIEPQMTLPGFTI